MIKYCIDMWNANKEKLESALRNDKSLNDCDYAYLLEKIVQHILNGGHPQYTYTWSTTNITVIDDGGYHGTLLFLIPMDTYQPCEYDYLMTYIGYGSCGGCDTLQAVQEYGSKEPTDHQLNEYMSICKDIVCGIIRPYNYGWRSGPEFCEIEME